MSGSRFPSAVFESLHSLGIADARLLIGVSGGADSVALLHALVGITGRDAARQAPRPPVIAAHLDHQLRGDESAADAAWVRELCNELGVPLVEQQCDVQKRADENRCGIEQAARDARYEFLSKTAIDRHCRFVLVAHTADDQVETILHRILRGTGLDGLRGIPRIRPLADGVMLARPLLDVRRTDLEAYLRSVNQSWRVDSTNRDLGMTRNRIRRELLPELRDRYNPQVEAALLKLARHAAEAQSIIDQLAQQLLTDCCLDADADVIRLDAEKLECSSEQLTRETLKRAWTQQRWPLAGMGFEQWSAASRVASGDRTAADLPGGVYVERRGRLLTLSRKKAGPRVETG